MPFLQKQTRFIISLLVYLQLFISTLIHATECKFFTLWKINSCLGNPFNAGRHNSYILLTVKSFQQRFTGIWIINFNLKPDKHTTNFSYLFFNRLVFYCHESRKARKWRRSDLNCAELASLLILNLFNTSGCSIQKFLLQ